VRQRFRQVLRIYGEVDHKWCTWRAVGPPHSQGPWPTSSELIDEHATNCCWGPPAAVSHDLNRGDDPRRQLVTNVKMGRTMVLHVSMPCEVQ
jgi:hypothetical protein